MPGELLDPDRLPMTGLGIVLVYGPLLAMFLARKRLGVLQTCALMVSLGVFTPVLEHSGFTFSGLQKLADLHARYHMTMAAGFTILVVLLFVTAFEVSGAGRGYYHGFPPSRSVGLVIYVYIPAWLGALALSYRKVFKTRSS